MAAGAENIMYRLECGEAAKSLETVIAGKLYCGKHEIMEEIAGVVTNEWRANCYSCRFARWAGLSQDTAQIFANGHMSRNRGHSAQAEFAVHPAAERAAVKFARYAEPAKGKHRATG
jgi:hypothetical protein